MSKTVLVKLEQNDIARVIEQVNLLADSVKIAPEDIVSKLVTAGKDFAQDAYNSFRYRNSKEGCTITGNSDGLSGYVALVGTGAFYEEFGTGERGKAMYHPAKNKFDVPLNDYNSGPYVSSHINKKTGEHIKVVSMLLFTNMNVLPFSEGIPAEIISYLDPTIEKLNFEEKNEKPIIHLKFKGKEEIVLNNAIELNNYLSSGTVKGMITFTLAQEVLKDGGYLIVDEIENHFNKEIVSTLIRFFMDGKINKNGGMLIFSTHYPELLDEYDRNDSIFITRNRDGITAENLSNILKRNDIKKSDAYQSGFLEGTTPTYEAYMQLKKSIAASLK